MARLILILCILCSIYAQSKQQSNKKQSDVVDVVAKTFNSMGNKTTITGDVKITRGSDVLFADKVVIFTDPNRKPINYEATGNVRFTIITEDKRELNGTGKRLIYDVKQNRYRLYDDAVVKEKGKSNVLMGDEIVLSGSGDYANVVGKNKAPARITFTLDDD